VQRGMDKNRKEELGEIKGKAKETVTEVSLSLSKQWTVANYATVHCLSPVECTK